MTNNAYDRGQFTDLAQLKLAISEPAYVLGTTISERLRTFGGRLFRADRHLQRLRHSLSIVGLQTREDDEEILQILDRVASASYQPEQDVGVVLLALPASLRPDEPQAELIVYAQPIDFRSFAGLYVDGQDLIISRFRQTPAACWPSELKCRSRMHYFLADREAHQKQPGARALLLDIDGYVAECSTANIVTYQRDSGFSAPLKEKTLPGISVSIVEDFANAWNLPFRHRDITPDELFEADEVLLCSTTPCVWPSFRVDGRPLSRPQGETMSQRLLNEWSKLVGISIQEQSEGTLS